MQIEQQIDKIITVLANHLGPGVHELYNVFIRQATIAAVRDSVLSLIGAVMLFAGVKLVKNSFPILHKFETEGQGLIYIIVGIVLTIIGPIVLFCNAYDIPTELLNPQFYAIQQLIQHLPNR